MWNSSKPAGPGPSATAPAAAAVDAGAGGAGLAARSVAPAVPLTGTSTGSSRSRRQLVSAGLVAGVAATAAVLAWHPGPARNDLSYDSFAAVRNEAWIGGLVDHIGWGLVLLTFPLAVCFLVRERGARLATIGSALLLVGGMFFVSTYNAFVQLAWYVTEPGALTPEAGSSLMAYLDAHPARLAGPEAVSFFALDIGLLLLCAALWRSGVVARWVPIATGVFTVAQFLVPGRALDVAQILLVLSLLPVAWALWRATSGEPAAAR